MGIGATFCCLFVVVGLLNLAFIIPDLIFAGQHNTCVTTIMQGIAFPLRTWLLVDAYSRIVITGLLLAVAIVSCVNTKAGVAMVACVTCTMLLYSLFMFAWAIVGAVLFWGKLNPAGLCSGGIQTYMHILLIVTFLSLCLNMFFGGGLGKGAKGLQEGHGGLGGLGGLMGGNAGGAQHDRNDQRYI